MACSFIDIGLASLVGHGSSSDLPGVIAGAVACGGEMGMEFGSNNTGLHRAPWSNVNGTVVPTQPNCNISDLVVDIGGIVSLGHIDRLRCSYNPLDAYASGQSTSDCALVQDRAVDNGATCGCGGGVLCGANLSAAAESV